MVDARTATALAGVAVSLLVSAVLWLYFETLLLFLFVPFVPFLFRGLGPSAPEREGDPAFRECPQCGFRTREEEYEYCPRDGRRLDRTDRRR